MFVSARVSGFRSFVCVVVVAIIFVSFVGEIPPDVGSVNLDPRLDTAWCFKFSWVTLFPLLVQGEHLAFARLSRYSG